MLPRLPLPAARTALLLLAGACASAPLPVADAERALAAAEAHVAAQEWDGADEQLALLEDEACPKRLRDRRDLATARVLAAQEELWEAFVVLERFADDYPHSDLRPVVVELIWDLGNRMARRGGGFLFFWSDETGARTALEHLVTRHPDSPRMADALRILGDMAFADGNHELAQTRFRDLMLHRPDSEWFAYAQYRFAMSVVASLEGPDYDLARMQHAVRELRDFLSTKPENVEIVKTAEAAVAQVLEWQVQRHLTIAGFYRTIGNRPGERHHLELAAGSEFATTTLHAQAVAARDEALRAGPASGPTPP